MDLNNKAIKILSKEHGQKVKQFLIDNGIDLNGYNFIVSNDYYCISNNKVSNTYCSGFPTQFKLFELPEEKSFPRMMLVWYDYESNAVPRLVLDKSKYNVDYPFIVLCYIDNEVEAFKKFNSGEIMRVGFYKHAKEIEESQVEVEEITLEQVCKALGKEIKIVK